MSVIILLIIFSIIVATGFLVAFIWAVKTGQFDDTSSPAVRILFDDQKPGRRKISENEAKAKAKDEDEDEAGSWKDEARRRKAEVLHFPKLTNPQISKSKNNKVQD